MGIVGSATLGRVWLVALAILLVGLLGEREAGLAAAILTLALVTVHLACLAISKLFFAETGGRPVTRSPTGRSGAAPLLRCLL